MFHQLHQRVSKGFPATWVVHTIFLRLLFGQRIENKLSRRARKPAKRTKSRRTRLMYSCDLYNNIKQATSCTRTYGRSPQFLNCNSTLYSHVSSYSASIHLIITYQEMLIIAKGVNNAAYKCDSDILKIFLSRRRTRSPYIIEDTELDFGFVRSSTTRFFCLFDHQQIHSFPSRHCSPFEYP